jgi:hypothetical protein
LEPEGLLNIERLMESSEIWDMKSGLEGFSIELTEIALQSKVCEFTLVHFRPKGGGSDVDNLSALYL